MGRQRRSVAAGAQTALGKGTLISRPTSCTIVIYRSRRTQARGVATRGSALTPPHCCSARRVDCARASGSRAADDLAGRSPRHRAVGSLTACHVFCRSSSVTACFEGWTSADHSHLSSFLRARAVEERCTIMCLRNVTKIPALGGENHLPVERQCRRSRATTGPR